MTPVFAGSNPATPARCKYNMYYHESARENAQMRPLYGCDTSILKIEKYFRYRVILGKEQEYEEVNN